MSDLSSILPLEVESLRFDAGGKTLVDGVSFMLPRGGITAVVGPNGAGKSLLLRLCHGLLAAAASAGGASRGTAGRCATPWCSSGP
jgi:tungstate transport system ATP-binding protein